MKVVHNFPKYGFNICFTAYHLRQLSTILNVRSYVKTITEE